jgi:phosphoribosylglycinamide formyltransferase 1
MKKIAIFASGKGSNADNICSYFKNHTTICVSLIVSDRKEAGVLDVATKNNVPSLYINKAGWMDATHLINQLKEKQIDFIVLAGFLKLIPKDLIQAFPGKIINIHPALLPKYGGQGMFGHHVHDAVYKSGDDKTGITIHYVDEHYDEGDVIFQASVDLNKGDGPEDIAAKIHQLEMEHFPTVIEKLLNNEF